MLGVFEMKFKTMKRRKEMIDGNDMIVNLYRLPTLEAK